MSRAFVSLGSNLDDPPRQLARALDALASVPRTRLVAASPHYWTAPVGDDAQPEFLNAAVELDTALTPHELLAELQRIEAEHGRMRDADRRWGPRTLDLDVLLFDRMVLRDPDLVVPHPRMSQRAFVLVPLADLMPTLEVPGQGYIVDLLARLDRSGVRPARISIDADKVLE